MVPCPSPRISSTTTILRFRRIKIVPARPLLKISAGRAALIFWYALLGGLLVVALPAAADPLTGIPSVIDGDTIEIHGQRIRLNGIDAPESAQLCLDAAGNDYRCGQKASLALADFLKAYRPTSCIEVDRDKFRRMVAVCTAGGVDIGEWMVRKGYALDWPKYSAGFYAAAENEARRAKRGVWSGSFEMPWEWRKRMTVN